MLISSLRFTKSTIQEVRILPRVKTRGLHIRDTMEAKATLMPKVNEIMRLDRLS